MPLYLDTKAVKTKNQLFSIRSEYGEIFLTKCGKGDKEFHKLVPTCDKNILGSFFVGEWRLNDFLVGFNLI